MNPHTGPFFFIIYFFTFIRIHRVSSHACVGVFIHIQTDKRCRPEKNTSHHNAFTVN